MSRHNRERRKARAKNRKVLAPVLSLAEQVALRKGGKKTARRADL